jgi:hypothetical protein
MTINRIFGGMVLGSSSLLFEELQPVRSPVNAIRRHGSTNETPI